MTWDLPRSIRVPNLKFLASPVSKMVFQSIGAIEWLGARGGVPKLARGSPLFFYRTPAKFGVNIVEWSMLNANVLDFPICFCIIELRR